MIDYQASGQLVGHCTIHGNGMDDRFVILVDRGGEWVVSIYINGSQEWVAGRYFDTLGPAVECFCEMTKRNNYL